MPALPIGARFASRPRLAASIDGIDLPGVIEIEVTQNVTQSADSFRVTLSLSQLEAAGSPFGWAYWAGTDQAVLDLRWGFVETGSVDRAAPFFSGYADGIRIDPVRNEIHISGRDASVLLLEAKSSEQFLNLTSSQIAIELATRRALTPDVTTTHIPSGRLYEIDHVRLAREESEWAILTRLADLEGFETYVTGRTLYFGPRKVPGAPFEIRWVPPGRRSHAGSSCNAVSLSTARNLIVARGIVVKVRSWNRKLGRSFSATRTGGRSGAPGRGGGAGGGAFGRLSGGPQIYSFDPPDLDQAGVERFADEQLRQLGRHEMRLEATFGAETTLGHHSVLSLTGTETEFDQLYYPEEIRRVQSYEQGFTTSVSAKNHDTRKLQGATALTGGD